MTIVGCLILMVWLGLIPLAVGCIPAFSLKKKQYDIGFMWISGHVLLWAMFQVICVGVLLAERFLAGNNLPGSFCYVVLAFGLTAGVFAAVGLTVLWIMRKREKRTPALSKSESAQNTAERIFGIIFAVLLAVQLICSLFLRYADGDDAYYVAVSAITESSNAMYKVQPYSVGSTLLDTRHSLAPFPVWIAFLARISGCHSAFVAHVAVSFTLIFMTYVIFGQIGKRLFEEKKECLSVFMCFTALLVIFGDYSIYTPENFMIARSRQGKAALGNIVIPMVILLFLMIFERYKEQKKAEWMIWVLLGATVTSACLCSALGTFLMSLFLCVLGVCTGVVYKKWEAIWKTALCCSPALIYAALYFVVG